MSAGRRLLPAPASSVVLALFWLVLVGEVSIGQIVLAGLLGLVVPIASRRLRVTRPPVRRTAAVLRLAGVFAYDLVAANIAVAGVVLGSMTRVQPRFVHVPLDIDEPAAIALLAAMVTLTPGTVSVDIDPAARAMTVHVLLAGDEQTVVEQIKTRYEARIKEIFLC